MLLMEPYTGTSEQNKKILFGIVAFIVVILLVKLFKGGDGGE